MALENSEEHDSPEVKEALAELQRVCDEERREKYPNGVPEWKPEL